MIDTLILTALGISDHFICSLPTTFAVTCAVGQRTLMVSDRAGRHIYTARLPACLAGKDRIKDTITLVLIFEQGAYARYTGERVLLIFHGIPRLMM